MSYQKKDGRATTKFSVFSWRASHGHITVSLYRSHDRVLKTMFHVSALVTDWLRVAQCAVLKKKRNFPPQNGQNTFFRSMQPKSFWHQCIMVGIMHWNPKSVTCYHRGDIVALFRGGKFLFFSTVDASISVLLIFNVFQFKYTAARSRNRTKSFHAQYTYQHLVENRMFIASYKTNFRGP